MRDLIVTLVPKDLITELNELTSSTLYYENLAKKLNNPLLQAKTYWSVLNYL